MTPQDLHLRLDIAYAQLNSSKNLELLPEVKDIILNNAVMESIRNTIDPLRDKLRRGYDDTIRNYSKLQRLSVDAILPVYRNDNENPNNQNQFNSFIDFYRGAEQIALYYGYTFLPTDCLEFGKALVYYQGNPCEIHPCNIPIPNKPTNAPAPSEPSDNTEVQEDKQPAKGDMSWDKLSCLKPITTKYYILNLNDFLPNSKLLLSFGDTRYPPANHTTIDLVEDYPYLSNHSEESNFVLVDHIINKVRNYFNSFISTIEPNYLYRNAIEVAYEYLDDIYHSGCIIFKKVNLPIEDFELQYPPVPPSTVPPSPLQLIDFTITRNRYEGNNNDGIKKAPCDLRSNVDIISEMNNHYANKNVIRNVPIAIKENAIFIKYISENYIFPYLRVFYIKKPTKINYKLNQMCELTNYDEIITIASRMATAHVNNNNEYQIKIKENE